MHNDDNIRGSPSQLHCNQNLNRNNERILVEVLYEAVKRPQQLSKWNKTTSVAQELKAIQEYIIVRHIISVG